jgi:hypothetical protein
MVAGALASVATSQSTVAPSPGGAPGVPDTGFEECDAPVTLCVTVVDGDDVPQELAWIELYDPDSALVADESVSGTSWCIQDLAEGEHLVVAELASGGSVSGSAELLCTDPTTELELEAP